MKHLFGHLDTYVILSGIVSTSLISYLLISAQHMFSKSSIYVLYKHGMRAVFCIFVNNRRQDISPTVWEIALTMKKLRWQDVCILFS